MIAYKFLRPGAVGPFSGFRWPAPVDGEPGAWVRSERAPLECRGGIHACRPLDLPWWLAAELWEVELGGDVVAFDHKVAALRGRLVRQVEAWTATLGREYAHACTWRARDRAVEALERADCADSAERLAACTALEDVRSVTRELATIVPGAGISLVIAGDGATRALSNAFATTAYIAAHAAGRVDGEKGLLAERRWQSDWLIERLGLEWS